MARPSKLKPEVADKIVRAIRAGTRAKVAAASAGISEATFYRWLADERLEFREFRESVTRANSGDQRDGFREFRGSVARANGRVPAAFFDVVGEDGRRIHRSLPRSTAEGEAARIAESTGERLLVVPSLPPAEAA